MLILFVCLAVLKLTGVIAWPWFWVAAPLWGVVLWKILQVALGDSEGEHHAPCRAK